MQHLRKTLLCNCGITADEMEERPEIEEKGRKQQHQQQRHQARTSK